MENQFLKTNTTFRYSQRFYAEVDQLALEQQSFDIMILDGPHGNGRSLAYPLFVTF